MSLLHMVKTINIFIICVVCFCVSHTIQAKEIVHNNIVYCAYKYKDDKGLICKGFADSTLTYNRLILPDSILVNGENKAVYAIDEFAFYGRKDLQYVKLPDTLHRIFRHAFANCENLDSVYIPESLSGDISDAFDESNIVSLTISPQNQYFDSRDNSRAIIESKNNVLLLGSANTTIPASVSKLAAKAFSKRRKLKHITIPKNICSIGSGCFHDCDNLFSVTFDDSDYKSEDKGLTLKTGSFANCINITNISLPNRLDSIEDVVFSGCKKLESIYISDRVCYISEYQFPNCESLKSIIVSPNNNVYDSRDNCNAIIETKTNKLIAGCKSTVIPNSIDTICQGAFSFINIDSVYIPIGVKSIEGGAFSSTQIRSVVIPESVTEIEAESFSFCNNLKNIYLGHSTPPEITDVTCDYMKEILTTEEEDDDETADGFSYFKDVCIHVSKIAYKKFKKHPIWKQLKIVSY